jgi:hypothetical protein
VAQVDELPPQPRTVTGVPYKFITAYVFVLFVPFRVVQGSAKTNIGHYVGPSCRGASGHIMDLFVIDVGPPLCLERLLGLSMARATPGPWLKSPLLSNGIWVGGTKFEP